MFSTLLKNCGLKGNLARTFAKIPEITTKYNVLTIPSLRDNYSYIVSDMQSNNSIIVDPSVAKFLNGAITSCKFNLKAIVSTHHHLSHVMGLGEMITSHPEAKVYGGPFEDSNKEVEICLKDGEVVELDDLSFKAIHTPFHSPDSMIYEFTEKNGIPFLFTGDTICLGGVGYVLEDQIDTMYSFIYDVLMNYPEETCFFHGHEYAEKYLKFALTLDPKNERLKLLKWGLRRTLLKAKNKPNTPTCLHDEMLINPFFRVNDPCIKEALGESDPKKAFVELVRRRNAYFKPRWSKWFVCFIFV